MEIVWKLKTCPVKVRLLFWNAIIKTKLMYGLYLIALTQSQQRRLNAVQNKGYRKILGLKTTYIERRNSVEFIFQRANNIVNTETTQEHRAKAEARKEANLKPRPKPKPPTLRPLSEEHKEQQTTYIAHLLREHHTEPTRAATFNSAAQFNTRPKCRVGGVRRKWTEEGFAAYWQRALPRYKKVSGKWYLGDDFDQTNPEHRKCIQTMAHGRFEKPHNNNIKKGPR